MRSPFSTKCLEILRSHEGAKFWGWGLKGTVGGRRGTEMAKSLPRGKEDGADGPRLPATPLPGSPQEACTLLIFPRTFCVCIVLRFYLSLQGWQCAYNVQAVRSTVKHRHGSQTARSPGCATLGKLFDLSGPQIPMRRKGGTVSTLEGCWRGCRG